MQESLILIQVYMIDKIPFLLVI